jgi:hypothetical protein
MKVTLDRYTCVVVKEPGDPTFRKSGWAYAESTFLHYVKKELIKQGHDVIKKRMWHDGHLVDEDQQYIRTRSWKKDGDFFIFNNSHAIYDAGLGFNDWGEVTLSIIYWQDL